MADLIDRQQAIATAISGRVRTLPTTEDGENWIRVNEVRDSLLSLPSAQPEIIRCKDCKWCEDADGSTCKNPASWVVATDCDFGCVLAERKENG